MINLQIPLLGAHQVENAATAYAALKLSGLKISDEAIARGFARVKWPGRFEVVRRNPPIILDSAHNQDSFVKLRETLDEYFPNKQVYLIFGASEDKNIPGMFAEMKSKIKWLIITRADHPRALPVDVIQKLADQAEIRNEAVTPVSAGISVRSRESNGASSGVAAGGTLFPATELPPDRAGRGRDGLSQSVPSRWPHRD